MAYLAPGKSMQTAFIENFNDRLRNELMNETPFTLLAQARVALAAGGSTTMPHARVLRSDGKHPPSLHFPIAQQVKCNGLGELKTG
jgi:hypothetical protein